MIGIYLASLLFGGVLIGVSLLLGGGDHGSADHGATADHEVTAEHDHDHGHADGGADTSWWLPFMSLRFWTFFMAAFGATGLLLSAVGLSAIAVALIPIPNGMAIGVAAAWFFHALPRQVVSAPTALDHLIGQEATVVLPIEAGDVGKIAVSTETGRLELPAKTFDRERLGPGDMVMIAAVNGGTAEVTATPGPKAITDRRRQSIDQ